jgi:hypothetical protein
MIQLDMSVDKKLSIQLNLTKNKNFESKKKIVSLIKIPYSSFTSSEKLAFAQTNNNKVKQGFTPLCTVDHLN